MTFSRNYYLKIIVIIIATFINVNISASSTHNEFIEKLIQIPDSLKSKTYDDLVDLIYNDVRDTLTTKMYANVILDRGRKNNDSTGTANGYYFLVFNSKDKEKVISYADSILEITKNLKHRSYPACAYLLKADIYFEHRNFKEAFDNYIRALNLSENKNNYIYYHAKHVIGLLKSRVGKDKEALEIFKECLKFERNKYRKNSDYLMTLFAMSDSHMRNKNYDSATYYNEKGYLAAKRITDYNMASYFSMNQGFNEFYKKNIL